MAQLNNVIGAILRDIAQSRVTSDMFSRKISQYYEQDSLLRLFPVPRSEIREIELDLKFSIADVSVDHDRNEERDARIGRIFERYSEAITEDIFENLKGSETIRKIKEWVTLVGEIDTVQLRLDIKNRILIFFEEKSISFMSISIEKDQINIELEPQKIKAGINEILEVLIYSRPDVKTIAEKYSSSRLLRSVKTSISNGYRDQIDAMDEELEFLEASEEFKVEIDMTAEKIQDLPEIAISSIKIKTDIRNYNWSQVEEQDGKIIRRLVPE